MDLDMRLVRNRDDRKEKVRSKPVPHVINPDYHMVNPDLMAVL
jgi:hypothetical protein